MVESNFALTQWISTGGGVNSNIYSPDEGFNPLQTFFGKNGQDFFSGKDFLQRWSVDVHVWVLSGKNISETQMLSGTERLKQSCAETNCFLMFMLV